MISSCWNGLPCSVYVFPTCQSHSQSLTLTLSPAMNLGDICPSQRRDGRLARPPGTLIATPVQRALNAGAGGPVNDHRVSLLTRPSLTYECRTGRHRYQAQSHRGRFPSTCRLQCPEGTQAALDQGSGKDAHTPRSAFRFWQHSRPDAGPYYHDYVSGIPECPRIRREEIVQNQEPFR